jgi:hypothetical protein
LPRDLIDDALLIVAELATNAFRHAGAPAVPHDLQNGRPEVPICCLSLLAVSDWLYISFYDEARSRPPVLRQAPDESETGRGVALVHGLTEGEWGWQPAADKPGKFVWARLKFIRPEAQGTTRQHPRSLGVSA